MPPENLSLMERLQYFPVTLFGVIMGYAGLTLAFQKATSILGVSAIYYQVLSILSILLFILILTSFLLKLLKHPQAVKKELLHPISSNFFSAITISLMLLSMIMAAEGVHVAKWLWYLGASLQFLLTIFTLNSWIHHQHWQIQHMTPAWFIPMVGNIIAPLGAVQFAEIEIAWFFFSVGLIFWLILQTIVMYRLFFHPPMTNILEPLLFIFLAPPSMAFLSYEALTNGQLDGVARVLYYTALFFALLLLSKAPRFIKVPFSLSWWAFTFPLAAMANASLVMLEKLHLKFFGFVAAFFVAILSALILHLTIKTFKAIKNRKLCIPTPAPL